MEKSRQQAHPGFIIGMPVGAAGISNPLVACRVSPLQDSQKSQDIDSGKTLSSQLRTSYFGISSPGSSPRFLISSRPSFAWSAPKRKLWCVPHPGDSQSSHVKDGASSPVLTCKLKSGQLSAEGKRVLRAAEKYARSLRHCLGSESILAGILLEEQNKKSVPANILRALGISESVLLPEVERFLGGPGPNRLVGVLGDFPYTPGAQKALENALHIAHSLGYQRVGALHLLVAILYEDKTAAGRIVMNLGTNPATIRRALLGNVPDSFLMTVEDKRVPSEEEEFDISRFRPRADSR